MTKDDRGGYKRRWYLRNRARILRKAHDLYVADPDATKARVKDWVRRHLDRHHEYLKSWRAKNPEKYKTQGRRAYDVRRGKIYSRVSDEILRSCRDDPRRAVGISSLAGQERAVCLECGEMHPALGTHIARRHMPLIAYRKKWGYAKNSPLASARVIQKMVAAGRRIAKVNHPVPPAVNHSSAAAGRREWAGARQKRLNLRDAHLRRLARGAPPPFAGREKVTAERKREAGRPVTKRDLFVRAKAMHDAGTSWSMITRILDPEGFRKDWRTAKDRIRAGVRGLRDPKK